jgi:hypothetical protein
MNLKSNGGQDKEKWRAVMNTIMNFRFPQIAGNFFSTWTEGIVSALWRYLLDT